MKKARFIVILMLTLAIMLAACAKVSDISGSVTPSDKEPVATGGTVTYGKTEENEPAEGQETADLTDEGDPESQYEMGSMIGGTYENQFIGIGCELDENWTYYTEEELLDLNGIAADVIGDEDISEQLRNSSVIYDMYAYADDGLVSINVCLENLGVLYGTVLDEESYVDKALESTASAIESMGFMNVECEKTSIIFAGEEHWAIKIVGDYVIEENITVPVYELAVCVKAGNYMACITFASYTENITEDLAALFYGV